MRLLSGTKISRLWLSQVVLGSPGCTTWTRYKTTWAPRLFWCLIAQVVLGIEYQILMSSLFFVTNSTFWDFVADVGIAYILERLYRIHQIQLLCDHQELAYTPKDPPWRVSMTQMSFRIIYGNIYWVIEKNVWKPTLVTPFIYGIFFPTPNVIHKRRQY